MDQAKVQGLAGEFGRSSNSWGNFKENPSKAAAARETAADTQKATGGAVSRWIFVSARSDVGQWKAMPDHPAKIIRSDWLQQMMIETRGLGPPFHVIA